MAWSFGRRWRWALGGAGLVVVGAVLGVLLWPRGDPVVLRIDRPAAIYVGVPAEFSALDSAVALSAGKTRAAKIRYSWDFGDGSEADGARAVHEFARTGDFPVRLTAEVITGSRYRVVESEEVVSVRPFPAPQVTLARPTLLRVRAGEPVEFVATASAPAGLGVATPASWDYEWRFAGGAETVRGQAVSYAFSSPGTYAVDVSASARTAQGNGEAGTTQLQVVVVPAAPDVRPAAQPNAPGMKVVARKPVVFSVETSRGADGSALEFEWDFDGDGFTDETTSKTTIKWMEGFSSGGDKTVTLRTWDSFAKDNNRPVTEIFTVPVEGPGLSSLASLGPIVLSGGGYSLGALKMAGGGLGWSFEDLGVSALVGYSASSAAVDIDRTAQFPEVEAAGYQVTTHIQKATAYTLTGTYALADPWNLSASVGLLTLEGEHRTSCRCLLEGKAPPLLFEEERIMVGVGVGIRIGFGLFLLQLVTSL